MYPSYTLTFTPFFSPRLVSYALRDAASDRKYEKTLFHVESGDYLLSVATLLGFVQEALAACRATTAPPEATLEREVAYTREALQYVNKRYHLTPR